MTHYGVTQTLAQEAIMADNFKFSGDILADKAEMEKFDNVQLRRGWKQAMEFDGLSKAERARRAEALPNEAHKKRVVYINTILIAAYGDEAMNDAMGWFPLT